MNKTFEREKQHFISVFNQARPMMTLFGDEVRQEIFLSLIEKGGCGGIRVGEIQQRCHISRSAVAHHLKKLLDAKIICMRQEGTKNYYYIDFQNETVRPIIEFWQLAEPMLEKCKKEKRYPQ